MATHGLYNTHSMRRDVKHHAQHFLRGRSFIAELIGHSTIRKNDTVLDIGAGSGAITSVLAQRSKHVIAYEPEPHTAALLRRNVAHNVNVTVVQQDFLAIDLPEVPYKVFSNIPFHLSSDIVRKLTSAQHPPKAIYLIVQKQFAQKLIPEGSHFHGALGMSIAPWWTVRIRRPLHRADFTPPPSVDTVLLEIKPRDAALLDRSLRVAYDQFVAACYADPRVYTKAGGPRDTRPSMLTVHEWVQLFKHSQR